MHWAFCDKCGCLHKVSELFYYKMGVRIDTGLFAIVDDAPFGCGGYIDVHDTERGKANALKRWGKELSGQPRSPSSQGGEREEGRTIEMKLPKRWGV